MPSKRITTLSLLFACQGLQMLGFGALALFLPLIRRDLELTYTQAGSLFAGSVTSSQTWAASRSGLRWAP